MNEKIAKEAAAFYLVGKDLFEKCKANSKKGEVASAEDMKVFPMIMNLAFSCELFLKSMLPENQLGRKSGHELRVLYNKLDDDTRNNLLQTVEQKYKVDEEWFERNLDKSSNAFFEWRYFYEPQKKLEASISILLYIADYFYQAYCEQYEQNV